MCRSTTRLLALALVFGSCSFNPSGVPSGTGTGTGNTTGIGPTGFGGNTQAGQGGTTGATLDMNCGMIENPVTRLPPDILVVLDKSGSMNASADGTCENNCGANSKWSQTTTALNQVITETDATVNWGLKLFATSGTCNVSNGVEVPITEMNAAAVTGRITSTTTSGSTPTRLAIQAAATYFGGVTDRLNPKFILLATDGLPNCAPGQQSSQSDMAGAIMSVQDAFGAGFPTFVVGIATTSDPMSDATLSAMATAGGYPRAGTPTYYSVASTAELVTALNAIISIAGSCTYPVPAPPNNMASRSAIDVLVNGMKIEQDPNNGWSYTNGAMTSIIINGPLCQQIMDGTVTDVKILFRCVVP